MSRKLVFKIDKEGNVLIDKVEGFGSSCLEATKIIERALGIVDESTRKFTEEFNEPATTDNSEHINH